MEHSDQRVRQASQFALVGKGADAIGVFSELTKAEAKFEYAALHALWGLGQLYRQGVEGSADPSVDALSSKESEVRANAARVVGDSMVVEGQSDLLKLLNDPSSRVVSLSAIALGRVASKEDESVVKALFAVAQENQGKDFDVTIRHSLLSALDRVAGDAQLSAFSKSEEVEQRLLCVLLQRRRASSELAEFLADPNLAVRNEALLAIYDTGALDGPAGQTLLAVDPKGLPFYHQARLVGACFRIGSIESAVKLAEYVYATLEKETRIFALKALMRWAIPLDTDPVLGHYRPTPASEVELPEIVSKAGDDLKSLWKKRRTPNSPSLLSAFASEGGSFLDIAILRNKFPTRNSTPSADRQFERIDCPRERRRPAFAQTLQR